MLIHVALTGPPRVILARSAVDLDLPFAACTLEDLLAALADAEPRIARYLRGEDGQPAGPLRPLLDDRLLEPGAPIPDGATVTLLYAIAGGTSTESIRSAAYGPSARGTRPSLARRRNDLQNLWLPTTVDGEEFIA